MNTKTSIIPQANINSQLPLLVLGVLGILGGVLALFLPETMDQELPQTIADGENFGKDQHFFDIPCDKYVLAFYRTVYFNQCWVVA